MPDEISHHRQAKHNECLLAEDILSAKPTIYPDWTITIAFYCALHLIDAELAKHHKIHSFDGGHVQRRRLVNDHFMGKSRRAIVHYNSLLSASIRARYDCVHLDEQAVSNALRHLHEIRQALS